ncbi:MAG: endonuclease VII domain-containing protein [Flavobacteriaceae bacterium]|nr:endonuclease VII domain-containing protein [Flavobacteriaceae bacterium]
MGIKINDFVLLKEGTKGIELNSVGLVKDIKNGIFFVFFVKNQSIIEVSEKAISFLEITKTGKPYEFKICNVCHILKEDFKDFEINQTDSKGRKTTRPSCRECRKNIDGISLKGAEKKKLDDIKPKHFFVCPICEKGSIPGVTANLVRDHDHETGKARDWLCDSCNTGLGRFKDNIELLEKAINYLKKYSNQI